VNIPLSELPRRTNELPPKSEIVRVAAEPELARSTVSWLASNGRRAERVESFDYAPAPEGEIGRLWEPTAFLAEAVPQLAPGTALDLACGTGRDSVYLASCGWRVTAADVLPDALVRGRQLAERCAAAIAPICWLQCDLECDLPDFDHGFDLIIIFRYLNRDLLRRLVAWLNPGGSVLCEAFTTLHRDRHGKPARLDRVLRAGELPTLLPGLKQQHYSEAWRGSLHTARFWGQRAASAP